MSYLCKPIQICTGLMILLFLSACGGSGGKSSTPPAPEIAAAALPDANISQAYNAPALQVSHGQLPLQWDVTAGTLPDGLALSAQGGLTGMPTESGDFQFTLEVSDALGRTDTVELALRVIDLAPSISTTTLPQSAINTTYSFPVEVADGNGPFTWSVASGALPAGLSFSGTGQLTGTPSEGGTFEFNVSVTDALDRTDDLDLTLLVVDLPPSITTTVLDEGILDTAYSATIGVANGNGPFNFELVSGSLPQGLTLSPQGLVSGMPGEFSAEEYVFEVRVVDSLAREATADVAVSIMPPSPIATATVTRIDPNTEELLDIRTLDYDNLTANLIASAVQNAPTTQDPMPSIRTAHYTYDQQSNVTETEYRLDDVVVRRDVFAYDTNGHRSSVELDLDVDGNVDRRTTYVNNVYGDVLERRYDSNADGQLEVLETFTYGEPGHPLTQIVDQGNDGLIETELNWTYGVDGTRALRRDYTYFSTPTSTTTYDWTDLPDGSIELIENTDTDLDSIVDRGSRTIFPQGADLRWLQQYGSFISQEYDYEADAIIDYTRTRTFDQSGLLLGTRAFADGPSNVVEYEYVYDLEGKLVEVRRLEDTVLEARWLVEYSDWYIEAVDLVRTPAAAIPSSLAQSS